MRWGLRWALFVAAALGGSAELAAQSPILNAATGKLPFSAETPAADAAPAEAPAQTKREEVAEKLRVAQRTLESAKESTEQSHAQPPERLQQEVELLKQLDVVLAQQVSARNESQDQQTRLGDLKSQLETVRKSGPPQEKPYSFRQLDQLRDELVGRQARGETVEAAVENAAAAVARAKQALDARQQAQRRLKEQSGKSDSQDSELATAARLAELEVRIAAEDLAVKKQQQANQQLAQELHHAQVALLEEQVRWLSQAAVFSERDLQELMLEIDKNEGDLRSELRLAEANRQYAESEWARARRELDAAAAPNAELVEHVEAKQLAQQLYQAQVSLCNVRLQRRGATREIWQRRFHVIRHSAATDSLIDWSKEAREQLAQLERENRLEQLRVGELQQDIAVRDKKLQTVGQDAGQVRRWIEEQREMLSQLIQVHTANIVSIETNRRLAEKLVAEIEGDIEQWSFSEWAGSARHYAGKIWNHELTTVDDHPLTVGKVLLGVVLVFLGFIVARLLSRTMGRRLQHGRIHMNESGAAALQSLSFYVLLVCFTLTALKFVNVPLTMFTFLGGAIAIGVGFGSQNILNNFICGLILLAERPIKVGDLIQINELYGNVSHIGARSTRIRTASNLEIIVPNSAFLENNVVNLTHGDDKLRTHVKVGIAYGSPTREATKLLRYAAMEHGRVLKNPEPFVWLAEFGDNALNFELHFWVKVRTLTEQKRIESDLRYQIDQLFRDAGITIAFPQRDVHIGAGQPLAVQVVTSDEMESRRGADAA